jgi:LDH2 family malate/lactate/ureidoglycolate dehydrogenase
MVKTAKKNINQPQIVTISLDEILNLGCIILKMMETPHEIASQVVTDLIINEINGYSSHGLLRLIEYVELLKTGHITACSQPVIHKKNGFVSEVDAQKCFGVLSSRVVSEVLTSHLISNHFGFVTVINSGHMGRLKSIALPVCKNGGVVIGFSNLSGAGQNVLAYEGNEGILCTNPIVIGVPSEPPIIVDMSTSTVSEGKVREKWLKGEKVPKGWLFDKNWESVCDPNKFYQNPQTAFLGPLGGKELGYKGFSLALMTEIFAGILTGGGFSQPSISKINNNALFFTFNPTIFGRTLEQFQQEVDVLIKYLKSSSTSDEFHVPGWNVDSQIEDIGQQQSISINIKLFQKLQCLADS